MNKVSPKSLFHSKWTKVNIENKEKHFVITEVEFDEDQRVTKCVIEAAMTQNEYEINWRELKEPKQWKVGWQ
ncbi:TIGR02450 family Trp-rich protein [Psychrosphaera haliotis]|uniref:TIGR02450 family Trp-rich protein n=1 Tax=Psychrosphaera haliotis TaxID=555083 RepID=A0A6N8FBY4_9GAMM|nr:TIGR02450 family Trp-rich protein [Psychrosphaera haliotis]MUH72667.1 TIGR02450 family Trp-rich protein [Psychrosphaera haliotis]